MLAANGERLRRTVRHRLDLAHSRLERAGATEWLREPLSVLNRREQQLDEAQSRLRLACIHAVSGQRRRLHDLEVRLASAHPRLWSRQRERIERLSQRLAWSLAQRLRTLERRVTGMDQRLLTHAPVREIASLARSLAQWQRRLERAGQVALSQVGRHLEDLQTRLESTSYRATLARGYTLTRNRRRQIITRAQDVKPGDKVITETHEGSFESTVRDAQQQELFE